MSLPRTAMQEKIPSSGSTELVLPTEGTVYVSCTMREAKEVGIAASQGPELDSDVNYRAADHCLHEDKSVAVSERHRTWRA